MGLISELMGISFGQADIYRRALEKMHKPANKKKVDYFNNNVVSIAVSRGFKKEEAEYIRKMIIDNCGYAFNKSHAVCYSYISYYTAWMKVNYPLIFHKTMLNGNLDNLSEYISIARGDNIQLLPPHINHSMLKTIIEDESTKSLRIGFNVVNGLGEKAVESIVENQPYNTINEFFEKNNSKGKNKKVVEALISAGCMEGVPIEVPEQNILDNLKTLGYDVQGNLVYLNRKQQEKWHEYYIEFSSAKSIPNYEVEIIKIKNKYLDQYEFIPEKDNPNVVIIPEILLELFDLTENDGIKSRKKPKGQLKELLEEHKIQCSIYSKPFYKYANELSKITIDKLKLYLEEVNKNDFSFLPHPLTRYTDMITTWKDAKDGEQCIEAGILTAATKRMTSNNKPYYWLILRTPKEQIRVTLWESQFRKYKKFMKQYELIAVKGIKGFGGMSCIDLKSVTPDK